MGNLLATTWQDTATPTIMLHLLLCASASVGVSEADVPMNRTSRQIGPHLYSPYDYLSLYWTGTIPPYTHTHPIHAMPPFTAAALKKLH